MENLSPLMHPQIKDGKIERFGFRKGLSLISGEWGSTLPLYSVHDCNWVNAECYEPNGFFSLRFIFEFVTVILL